MARRDRQLSQSEQTRIIKQKQTLELPFRLAELGQFTQGSSEAEIVGYWCTPIGSTKQFDFAPSWTFFLPFFPTPDHTPTVSHCHNKECPLVLRNADEYVQTSFQLVKHV